jgi:tripartite-type tricarboxylate transporter receptor subunit TctC
VVTKPGAGGSIAAADVISSKPDGYKLVMLTNIFFATTTKIQKIPFNPSDLIPIANAMEMRAGMLVRSDSPYKTLADLLDYARKSPGKLRWAHAGRGISVHMNAALIFRKAGVETIDVPYKGAPEILTALLGGHVDAITQTHGSIVGNVEAGSVRYLVFYSDRRYRDFPNVPCAAELGFTEVGKLATFFGYYAHKDTPEKIKETLVDAFGKVCEDPGFRKGIEKIGEEPNCGGPEFLKKAIKEAEEIGVPMLKELGLYVGK